MSSRSSAPTGHHAIAQGATLGIWPTPSSSPERAKSGRLGINIIRGRPYRAENHFDHLTHGVAMGYRISPRWGGDHFDCTFHGVAMGYRILPRWGNDPDNEIT